MAETALTAALAPALLTAPALAQPKDKPGADQVYAEAVQALKNGDCDSGADYLRTYIKMAPATLAARPDFRRKVYYQLRLCGDGSSIVGHGKRKHKY